MIADPDAKTIIIVSAYMAEGCDPGKIDLVAREIEAVPDTVIISIDPNRKYNRTNLIWGGPPEAVLESALRFAGAALANIDMRQAGAESALFGAIDLVSFLPLHSRELPRAVKLSKQYAREIARQFELPVYLFGFSTRAAQKKNLNFFRQNAYRDLPDIIDKPRWKPDYGPRQFREQTGVCIVGARYYHINLALYFDTEEVDLINRLSEQYQMQASGGINSPGEEAHQQALRLLARVKMAADKLPDEKIVRLICNISDYLDTPLAPVIKAIREEAGKLGIEVVGCEILGYLPAEALVNAGRHFLADAAPRFREDKLRYITLAIQNLQLSSIMPFDLNRQVLDYHFEIDLDHV
ncbi:MAG: hypothetical protein KDH97_12660 [Calditrichaeota bacterium]|nr:hypothetical protein [Calditrichota bacterium]